MKIRKIENLTFKEKNVCCNYKQEQDFDDINIIFGMNGSGKTAISRLINSYSSLINRKRDNDIEGYLIDFEGKYYNKKDEKNKFFVFNADFIQENLIYNSENNTSINDYSFDLSAATKKYNQEILECEKNIDESESKINEINYNIDKKFIKIQDQISSFYTLFSLSDVKEHYNYNQIKNSKVLSDSDLNSIKSELEQIKGIKDADVVDINQLFNILFTNIDDVMDDYDYFLRVSRANPSNGALIKLYNESQEINPLSDIPNMKTTKYYREIQSKLLDIYNKSSIIFSKFLVPVIINVDNSIFDKSKEILTDISLNIHNVIKKLIRILEEKYNNLLNRKESSSAISCYQDIIKEYTDIKNKYSENINTINEIITEYNNIVVNHKVKAEKLVKTIINHFCSLYAPQIEKLKKDKQQWEEANELAIKTITSLKDEINNEAKEFKEEHLENINTELKRLDLNIKLVWDNEKSGKLKLLRNNDPFPISKFSEGQKNIILFFYFISIFKNYMKRIEGQEESVIVVVDDPHCSLDKMYTYNIADIIVETFITSCEDNKISQFFLFSHCSNFLVRFNFRYDYWKNNRETKDKDKEKTEDNKSGNKQQITKNVTHYSLTDFILTHLDKPFYSFNSDYINKYRKIRLQPKMYEKRKFDASLGFVWGEFIEDMGSKLFPRYKELDLTAKMKKICGKKFYEAWLINFLRHYQSDYEELEKKEFIVKLQDYVFNTTNEYVKKHLDELDDAIGYKKVSK